MKRSTATLVLTLVISLGCSKKQEKLEQKNGHTAPFVTFSKKDGKNTIYKFEKDTSFIDGNFIYEFSYRNGKGKINILPVSSNKIGQSKTPINYYNIDSDRYIGHGMADGECTNQRCIFPDDPVGYLLLGAENTDMSSYRCLGDGTDLMLIYNGASQFIRAYGSIQFRTPISSVPNHEHLDCWIAIDPTETVWLD